MIGFLKRTVGSILLITAVTGYVKDDGGPWGSLTSLYYLFFGVLQACYGLYKTTLPEPEPEPLAWYQVAEMWILYYADLTCGLLEGDFVNWLVTRGAVVRSILIMVALVLVYFILVIVPRMFRKMFSVFRNCVLRTRGVVILESAVAGSNYAEYDNSVKMPNAQVSIMVPGLLSDTHSGYGVRVGDFIVTATHVIKKYDRLILCAENNGKLVKIQVPAISMLSQTLSDISYVKIPDSAFSQLGLGKAGTFSLSTPMVANAFGKKGMSSGLVMKNRSSMGRLIYNGSTEPGMSGGGIWIQNKLVGIHHGVVSDYNTSTYALAILHDMSYLVSNESPMEKLAKYDAKDKVWTDDQVKEHVDKAIDKKGASSYMATTGGLDWATLAESSKDLPESSDAKGLKTVVVKTTRTGYFCRAAIKDKKRCLIPFETEQAMLEHEKAHVKFESETTVKSGLVSDKSPDVATPAPSTSFLGQPPRSQMKK